MVNCSGDDGQKKSLPADETIVRKHVVFDPEELQGLDHEGRTPVQVDPPPLFHFMFSWVPQAMSKPPHCAFVCQIQLTTQKKSFFLPFPHKCSCVH